MDRLVRLAKASDKTRPAGTAMAELCGVLLVLLFLLQPAVSAETVSYHDDDLTNGFYKTVFGSEISALSWGSQSKRVKKYVTPVRIWIDNRAKLNRLKTVRAFVKSLPQSIPGLQIKMARNKKDANFTIYVVDAKDYIPTVQNEVFKDKSIQVPGECIVRVLSRRSGILRSDAVIVSDKGRATFQRCMVEEILQGLGPVNDDKSLIYSIFNDESRFDYFTQYDRMILNMLYSPDLRPGMTLNEVKPLTPHLLRYARKIVEKR
ncbi:DUF2927 domain-containing protein [uncultured Cohaesibacter sp.]|uniref:DUF2927 domain-containing protein n=1 Tax=uncultured Cohaesibacter sp. TaxID=1002546 RepID=UPI00292DB04D|nr:DUF2927 domain-containing protein [uncultured Cohaesibacter sp.]